MLTARAGGQSKPILRAEQRNCPNCNEQLEIPRSFQDVLRKQADGTGGTKHLSQPEAEHLEELCPFEASQRDGEKVLIRAPQ
jgi:hypothetical protein